MLIQHGVERGRVDLTRAEPLRLHCRPAIPTSVFLFFQNKISLVTTIKLPHRGILLLHTFKEVQDCLTLARQFHLRGQIHIDVKVVR